MEEAGKKSQELNKGKKKAEKIDEQIKRKLK